jgi:cbb3-type cytochrome oxidase subunit 1
MQVEQFQYDNKIVRNFAFATVLWGAVGMLVGLIVSLQLVFPTLLNITQFGSFGRLRPLHTNAVIFAFVAATETTIRTLSDFKEEKIIEMKGSSITILNREKLESMRN